MAYLPSLNNDPKTAFGELRVSNMTPIAQIGFVYNINNNLLLTGSNGTATITFANAKATLSTGATAGSSASIESRDSLKYRPGQGGLARFTALFDTGSPTGSTQFAGIADNVDQSNRDGLGFMMSGSSFGIVRIQNGTENFISQSDWNIDKMDGSLGNTNPSGQTLNPEFGNVYQVEYQWLGYGAIRYYIEDAAEGTFQEVHKIQYANANTTPSIYNPKLPMIWYVQNGDNAQDVTLEASSAGLFVEGSVAPLGPINSAFSTASAAAGAHLLTVKNETNFPSGSSTRNKNDIFPKFASISNESAGAQTVVIKLIKNATITSPSWIYVDEEFSPTTYDVAGSYTADSGTQILTVVVTANDSKIVNLTDLNLPIKPTDSLSFVVDSGISNATGVSLTWQEDL